MLLWIFISFKYSCPTPMFNAFWLHEYEIYPFNYMAKKFNFFFEDTHFENFFISATQNLNSNQIGKQHGLKPQVPDAVVKKIHTWNFFSIHDIPSKHFDSRDSHGWGTLIVSTCCRTLKLSAKTVYCFNWFYCLNLQP